MILVLIGVVLLGRFGNTAAGVLFFLPFIGYGFGYYAAKGQGRVDYDSEIRTNVNDIIVPRIKRLQKLERSARYYSDADIRSSNKYIRKIISNYDSASNQSEIDYLYNILRSYRRKEIRSKWIIRITADRCLESEWIDNPLDYLKSNISDRAIIVEDISNELGRWTESINDALPNIYPHTDIII